MKKLVLLLLLSIPCARLEAQGIHGKILVVRDSTQTDVRQIANPIAGFYTGKIDSASTIPVDISTYDGVFLLLDHTQNTLSLSEQFRLIEYLKLGGKLYAEGYPGFGTPSSLDTLWRFVGIQSEFGDASEQRWDTIYGVDTEFTHGIGFSHTHSSPVDYDALEGIGYVGNLVPVLWLCCSFTYPAAYIPSDRSIKAVLYKPFLPEAYTMFLQRVVCEYFGLCDAAVSEIPISSKSPHLTLYPNPATSSIHCAVDQSGDSPATMEVLDVLGRDVLISTVGHSSDFTVDARFLTDGVYGLIVRSGGWVVTGQFVVAR